MTVKDLLYNISFVTKPTAYCFANVFNVFFSKEDNCVYFYNENVGQKEIPISEIKKYLIEEKVYLDTTIKWFIENIPISIQNLSIEKLAD